MIEKSALYLHLAAYGEKFRERYVDDSGHLLAETVQRLAMAPTGSRLRRPGARALSLRSVPVGTRRSARRQVRHLRQPVPLSAFPGADVGHLVVV